MLHKVAYLASLLGLGGSDVINVETALQHVHAQLLTVVNYHGRNFIELPNGFGADLRTQFLQASKNGSVEVEFVRETLQSVIAGVVFGRRMDVYQLPPALARLPHIYQLMVQKQWDDWSCGYWSAFNAVCMQRQIQNNGSIDLSGINEHAITLLNDLHQQLRRLNHFGEMATPALIYYCGRSINRIPYQDRQNQQDMAHETLQNIINDNHLFVLQFGVAGDHGQPRVDDVWPDFIINPPGDEDDFAHIPEEVLVGLAAQDEGDVVNPLRIWANQELNRLQDERTEQRLARRVEFFDLIAQRLRYWVDNNEVGAFHFVCNVALGRHWYLVSIVKLRNRKPLLIICDSAPGMTRKHPGTFYPMIQFLHRRYIAPYVPLP